MVMIDILAGGVGKHTISLIKWLITAYAVTINDNNDPNNKDNSDETNIHNDNNNPNDNSVYVDKIKISVKILDTYGIYNAITSRIIGTVKKKKKKKKLNL